MPSIEDTSSELCKECGLCCRGLLHSHAILKRDELAHAASLGLAVVDGTNPAFKLPCPLFDLCCTVYQHRPSPCRGYRCALLRRLDEQEIELDEALGVVREAHRLVEKAMPGSNDQEAADGFRSRRLASMDGPAASGGNNEQKLNVIALGTFLDRHFVLDRDGTFYSTQPISSSNG